MFLGEDSAAIATKAAIAAEKWKKYVGCLFVRNSGDDAAPGQMVD